MACECEDCISPAAFWSISMILGVLLIGSWIIMWITRGRNDKIVDPEQLANESRSSERVCIFFLSNFSPFNFQSYDRVVYR